MLKPPQILDSSTLTVEDFDLWCQAFKSYLIVNELDKKDEKVKIHCFESCGGMQLLKIVNSLNFTGKTLDACMEAVKKYIKPVRNLLIERNKFFQMTRENGEELNNYVLRLKQQASVCDFSYNSLDSVPNLLIRDQFLLGLKNTKVLENVLSQPPANLAETVSRSEAYNQAIKGAEVLNAKSHDTTMLHVKRFSPGKQRGRFAAPFSHKSSPRESMEKARQCFTCHRMGHLSKDCFKNQKCKKCKKFGHSEQYCRIKHVNYLWSIDNNGKLIFCDANIGNAFCKCLVDTGAGKSILSEHFVNKNGLQSLLKPCSETATVADGRQVKIKYFFEGIFECKRVKERVLFWVMDIPYDAILGIEIIKQIGLNVGPSDGLLFSVIPELVLKYYDVFDRDLKDSSLTGVDPFEIIKLNVNAEPVAATVCSVPLKHRNFVKNKIKELLDGGVIEESTSQWRHNIIVVPKSAGWSRLTINYKPVNKNTVFDAYPFPVVEDLLPRLSKAKYFSSLDFKQFYHQLPLLPSDQSKTAFTAFGKLYQFKRCPFGLKNAVAYCQRLMHKIFENFSNVIIYLDDIVIFGEDKQSHDDCLEKVLQRIRQAGLSLNRKKCSFTQNKISFLGYIIENGTVKPDPERCAPIKSFPKPISAHGLQRFLME